MTSSGMRRIADLEVWVTPPVDRPPKAICLCPQRLSLTRLIAVLARRQALVTFDRDYLLPSHRPDLLQIQLQTLRQLAASDPAGVVQPLRHPLLAAPPDFHRPLLG